MLNEPVKSPDFEGRDRAAWLLTFADGQPRPEVASYLVRAPGAHPFWSWWLIAAIHLRSVEGLESPEVYFPGATHEVFFIPLNPDKPLPDVDAAGDMAYLTPIDLAHQVILPDDAGAESLIEQAVIAIVKRGLSPDSDYCGQWQQVLNVTSEHIRLGGHPS